jgi:hypothetical protein
MVLTILICVCWQRVTTPLRSSNCSAPLPTVPSGMFRPAVSLRNEYVQRSVPSGAAILLCGSPNICSSCSRVVAPFLICATCSAVKSRPSTVANWGAHAETNNARTRIAGTGLRWRAARRSGYLAIESPHRTAGFFDVLGHPHHHNLYRSLYRERASRVFAVLEGPRGGVDALLNTA